MITLFDLNALDITFETNFNKNITINFSLFMIFVVLRWQFLQTRISFSQPVHPDIPVPLSAPLKFNGIVPIFTYSLRWLSTKKLSLSYIALSLKLSVSLPIVAYYIMSAVSMKWGLGWGNSLHTRLLAAPYIAWHSIGQWSDYQAIRLLSNRLWRLPAGYLTEVVKESKTHYVTNCYYNPSSQWLCRQNTSHRAVLVFSS